MEILSNNNLKLRLSVLIKNKLLYRTVIYTVSSSISAMIGFLLLPVLTRYLTPYDFGIVETFSAITACLTGVTLMGGSALLAKDYFALNKEAVKEIISEQITIIGSVGFITLIIIFIISKFSGVLEDLIKINNGLIMLAVCISVSNALILLLTTLFQLKKQTIQYAFFVNLRSLTGILTSIYLIVFMGFAWEGRISGIAISSFLFSLIAIIILIRFENINNICPSKKTLSRVAIGFPIMIAHMSAWIMEMIDKLMITHFIGLDSTGLYSVGYQFGMILMMIETAFSRAWLPFFYEKIQTGRFYDNLSIVKSTYFYLIVLLFIALIIGIGGKYLLYLMVDEKFYKADQFIFLISMGYFFDGMRKVFVGYLIHLNKIKLYSFLVALSALVNVVFNLILLPRIGLIGAAWATLIAFAFGSIITMIIAINIYKMPWFLGRLQ